jgi:hypothetical protein
VHHDAPAKETPTKSPLLGVIVAIVGIVLAVTLFTVRLWTHCEPAFVEVSIQASKETLNKHASNVE